ncbi:unnamed protein product [Bacillus phage SPP1]|uniref:Bacteriophage SPP1 complete nucleotide sequence n=1 Tax=Bacillus phage SPP1 TaxID=10724 RepID=O48478_BPSPP|nr:hypothetical protein SPP1p058 [Bacillus phage SPP1]CAA66525.1 unnamed protein product [Bacillus phage SPP1]
MFENHLQEENAELRRRNEELGKEIERQNEVIKSQNWRLLYLLSYDDRRRSIHVY